VIDQNFYYAGLKFTGPTFACAMSNILPAMTFVMAVIFRYGPASSENCYEHKTAFGTHAFNINSLFAVIGWRSLT
jgi:hypothetical protein